MGLFSSKKEDAASASLFAKTLRRDDLVNQAREAGSNKEAPAPAVDRAVDSAPSNEVDNESLSAEEDHSDSSLTSNHAEEQEVAEEAAIGAGSDSEEEAIDSKTEPASDDMERTLFVKNVPYSVVTDKKKYRSFRKLFEPGVKSVRFRSFAMSEMMPRKAAFIKHKLHPSRDAVNSYIVYTDGDRVYDAMNEINGQEFEGHHLFVDHAAHPRKQDAKRSVFVGNLPFEATEEALYAHFEDCGAIENLRIVRDPQFNLGKGFAYVQFEDVSTIQLALLKNSQKFENRELRVTRCQSKATKKPNKPAQKPLYQRKAEPQKRRRRERVDESGMVLEGERARVGKPGIDKKRRRKASAGPKGGPKGGPKASARPKRQRHN